ncbi:MAG: hypothetical protein NZO58_14285, partial [Gemmataceae bacterium]|nr:hypothetical protein [Gemmataceae bacterium]
KIDWYTGRTATPALLAYLDATLPLRSKDRVEALVGYAKYLGDADPAVAEDAFVEFASSRDADVGEAGRRLHPSIPRRLVHDPAVGVDKLSLAAFLLGCCGDDRDAQTLRALIDAVDPAKARALDGILAGYIQLRPKDGWQIAFDLLADRKQPFAVRYAVVRTLSFYHGWQPKESRPQVLRALAAIVPDGELADLAAENLRRWQIWDLTDLILAQFGKQSHDAPIIKRSLVRYALSCPLPQAREFVERVRRSDRELVADLEEYLQIERK